MRVLQGLVAPTNELERAFGWRDVSLADRPALLTLAHHPSHLTGTCDQLWSSSVTEILVVVPAV